MELRRGSVRAVVDPQGGRLASLAVDGIELLVTEGERPTRWGSFPMVPWCGRLRDGELAFGGATHSFPLTSPPHANHGFGHLVRWTQDGPDSISVGLAPPEGDDDDPRAAWPYGGKVVQRFELGDEQLSVSIEVHADGQPFPAMAGWHPWFRRDLDRSGEPVGGPAQLLLELDDASVYALGDDGIPNGELAPPPPGPWDACVVGIGSDPVIRWPGALDLTISSTFDHWVVFTEPPHALCVEPESGAPNDTNRAPFVVRSGSPLVGSMTLAWRLE